MKEFLSRRKIFLEQSKGFTLLEVLLVIATITILAGFSLPISAQLQIKNDLDIATSTVVQSLRRAEILSQAVDGDIGWGVHIGSGNITLFKGNTYATRDTNFDETTTLQPTITPSGIAEIDFAKFTGLPGATGTITLKTSSDTKNITINEKGAVDY